MAIHRFLLVDNHPLIRTALRQIIEAKFKTCEIKESISPYELARTATKKAEPHLVTLDLQTRCMRGFSGLLQVRARLPKARILIFTEDTKASIIRRALTLGASGFVSKEQSVSEIRAAITSVLAGKKWLPPHYDLTMEDDPDVVDMARRLKTLTPQQQRIFGLMREGLLNKQIAYDLDISEATVKAHVSIILSKLGAQTRTEAVIITNPIDQPLVGSYPRPVA